MPQELPGFYYDAEKNRYFPINSRNPGTPHSRSKISFANVVLRLKPKPGQETKSVGVKLLQARELNGNVFSLIKGKCNFKEQYQKKLASYPVVFKYQGANDIGDAALEQIHMKVETFEGQLETEVLLTGSSNGSLSFVKVGNTEQQFDEGVKCTPDLVCPLTENDKAEISKAPQHIWKPSGSLMQMSSSVSCIKVLGEQSPGTINDGSDIRRALITTLGSAASGGSIYVLNLTVPLDSDAMIRPRRINEVATFGCTIWTADCGSNASQVVIGTNLGASMVNLETGTSSWVCRSQSDVLAQQLDHSGNVVLCGLRNGAIVTVDIRERAGLPRRLVRHKIACSRTHREDRPVHLKRITSHDMGRHSIKKWFELRGNICPSRTNFMPSSISSLVSLRSYDDMYFLASSMDGTVKLYDLRSTKQGAVQSYEGHVNSHSRIQMGVDDSERFILSGGEDRCVRIWSIKTGDLLFQDKFSDSIPISVCWRQDERLMGTQDESCSAAKFQFRQICGSEAWLGTREGLLRMQW